MTEVILQFMPMHQESMWLISMPNYVIARPSDLLWARIIVPLFKNMTHHFPRQWAQWTHPF